MATPNISQAIAEIVKDLMDRVMNRVLVTDPFIVEKHHAAKPLYAALVPDEIFKGSHFERRFVTPFGNTWEKLAMAAAKVHHGCCVKGYSVEGTIGEERLRRIQEVLNRLEHKSGDVEKQKPNWNEELEYIMQGGGAAIPVTVVCDIFIDSKLTGKKYAFELKGPLPNSDQTKVSKEKMFKLLAMNEKPVDYVFYASSGFDEILDVGECFNAMSSQQFWDFIGGDGTYNVLESEVIRIGKTYKERILREYLGV